MSSSKMHITSVKIVRAELLIFFLDQNQFDVNVEKCVLSALKKKKKKCTRKQQLSLFFSFVLDCLPSYMESWSLVKKEHNKLQAQLADFPHTFQLQNLERLGPSRMKRLKSDLESALSVGYKTELETALP